MTPWLIFGAGSGVGAELITLGLREKRPLFALVRNPEQAQALREKACRLLRAMLSMRKKLNRFAV